jgi:hypothetical protein
VSLIAVDAVATVCTPVRLAFLWRPTLRDPDDDMVLEAAVNGQVHAIRFALDGNRRVYLESNVKG